MIAIARFWHSLARVEKAILLVCSVALLFFAGSAWSRSRSVQQLPPVFEDAPKAAGASTSDGAVASQQSGASIVVHVAGEVYRPGVLSLHPGARVADAVEAAGGVKPEGDADALNLAQELKDGEQVRIPKRVAIADANASAPDSRVIIDGQQSTGDANFPAKPVNINTASAQELENLPGIGPALAQRIITQRAQHRFSSLDDLDAVDGLGPKKLEKLKPYVTF